MEESKHFIKEETIRFLNRKVTIFEEELNNLLEKNKETMDQIRSISDLNMPNMISRLKKFAKGLAMNQLKNYKDSSEISRCFIRQYERLDDLEKGMKSHQISCANFRAIRNTFEAIDVATREILIQNSDVPPLF